MGPDFVYGVINAIDGERDPRILFQIFDFLPMFFQHYPLRHLSEEFFEVCACYFPVDFHPAANDPAGITRDKLAERLLNCLCGTEDFAEHCITLLLEKLDSGLNVAKLDSLDLLVSIKTLDSRFMLNVKQSRALRLVLGAEPLAESKERVEHLTESKE